MIKLSPREMEVLSSYVRLGRWNLVAEALSLSIGTVKFHRQSAMRKLGACNSVQLTAAAIIRGLVDLEPKQEGINEKD